MEEGNFKFGRIDSGSHQIRHDYEDSWASEKTTGPDRLVMTPSARQIDLLRELSLVMDEPFGILYVLVVPRSNDGAGRYQSPHPVSREDVLSFLSRFEDFLESDGRHNLWIASVGEPELLVYDRHILIYAYGRLPSFKKVLSVRAIPESPQIKIPSPHVHCYHKEYDEDAAQLLRYWNWIHSPLRDQDDD